jgi:hypothetical protein
MGGGGRTARASAGLVDSDDVDGCGCRQQAQAKGEAMTQLPEPTPEQCERKHEIEHMGRVFIACYYPQMGGYSSKCLVEPLDGCFNCYVWHDGEFPFGDDRAPVELHHCDADQFIRFGQFINSLTVKPEGESMTQPMRDRCPGSCTTHCERAELQAEICRLEAERDRLL